MLEYDDVDTVTDSGLTGVGDVVIGFDDADTVVDSGFTGTDEVKLVLR